MSATPIDLSRLPVPEVIETVAFETLLAERKARFVALHPAAQREAVAATLAIESEPVTMLLQESAYREVVLRQRVNDAARSVMLAYAKGNSLEHLAALFGIRRHLLTAADPDHNIDAVYEDDEDLKERTQLAPQGFSVAGPEGAYISHARNASALVLDVSATSPRPCEVIVTVLSRVGDGTAAASLLDAVASALQSDDVRPLTDKVTVQSVEVVTYAVDADLFTYVGPDAGVVIANARQRLGQYTARMHRLNRGVTLSGIYAALHIDGMERVALRSPLADIPASKTQAAYCNKIELRQGGNNV